MTRPTASETDAHREHVERVRAEQRAVEAGGAAPEEEADAEPIGQLDEAPQVWRPEQGVLTKLLAWLIIFMIIAGTIAMGVAAVWMMTGGAWMP